MTFSVLGGGSSGYQLQRSLRFRSSASAYLSRTPASAGNRQTWTWSGWVKRGALTAGTRQTIFSAGSANRFGLFFDYANNQIDIHGNGSILRSTSAQYRDISAFYHILIVADTNNGTAQNRLRLYINGSEITAFSTNTTISSGTTFDINSAVTHEICRNTDAANLYFDGYLAEVNFIDGQALTPSSFGQTDAVTGVWTPKKYTGTYGTNGFYLPFSDNTSATTLAYDKSGNGNNWTANNISTTAGATYDSMTDVPTLTSATAANYCVLNPLSTTSNISLSDANLGFQTTSSASWYGARGTFGIPTSGKWYFEVTTNDATTIGTGYVGVMSPDVPVTTYSSTGTTSTMWGYVQANGNKTNNGSSSAYGNSWAASGDVVGIAVDMDNLAIYFAKNNTWQNSGDPTSGASKIGAAFTNLSGVVVPMIFAGDVGKINANFGQRPFSYTPPTGFKALNTFNLPDPTIKKPNQYMDATTYTGNGGTLTVTNSGSMQPDLVWVKDRTTAYNHNLIDSVRGGTKVLRSSSTDAESTETNGISSFNSNGYTVGTLASANSNGDAYVAWQWKKGATPGFDIVTYTGNGVSGRTVAHSLGVAPAMIIVKNRNSTQGWQVQHQNLTAITYNLYLQATDSQQNDAQFLGKSSTTVTLNQYSTNTNGNTYVMYLWAEIPGYSKFGSYTGNGSADGPFVYCGFRPRWVLIKNVGQANSWFLMDTVRGTTNVIGPYLYPDQSAVEATFNWIDILSNGFKIRDTGTGNNNNGISYIYAAFAESPFKYALGR